MPRRSVLTVLVAVALLTVAAPTASPAAARTLPAPAGCLPAGETAASISGPYAVGERTVTFVDHTRSTAADPSRGLPFLPYRTLVTTLLYPATGPALDSQPVVGAPEAPGAFPLVEFSHGVTATGPEYVPELLQWARAGYVVAAPTFPLSSGPGGEVDDVVNQPADVSFVLTSVSALAEDSTDALFGHVATNCIAIAGHSLGAVTTLDAVYNSCCADVRARAAVEISGLLLPIDHGTFASPPPVPMLMLQGDQDDTVPYSLGQLAYAKLPSVPREFVTFVGAGHISLFGGPWGGLLRDSVVSFLDYELKGDVRGYRGLARRIRASGVATLQRAGGLQP